MTLSIDIVAFFKTLGINCKSETEALKKLHTYWGCFSETDKSKIIDELERRDELNEIAAAEGIQHGNEFTIIDNTFTEYIRRESPWGNRYITITNKDLRALKKGKSLFFSDGEYGTFVRIESSEG